MYASECLHTNTNIRIKLIYVVYELQHIWKFFEQFFQVSVSCQIKSKLWKEKMNWLALWIFFNVIIRIFGRDITEKCKKTRQCITGKSNGQNPEIWRTEKFRKPNSSMKRRLRNSRDNKHKSFMATGKTGCQRFHQLLVEGDGTPVCQNSVRVYTLWHHRRKTAWKNIDF